MFEAKFKERSQIEAFFDVALCLFEREFKSKFGAYRYGLLWLMIEPTIHVVTFVLLLGGAAGLTDGAEGITYFVLSGIVPFFIFRSVTKGIVGAIKSNKAMFSYPSIQPIHIVFAKVMYETFTYALSFAVIYFLVNTFLSENNYAVDYVLLIATLLATLVISSGVGLFFMVLREFKPSIEKMVNIAFRPLYFLSGIFYSISVVPEEYQFIFEFNPIAHIIELTRYSLTGAEPVYGNILFVAQLGVVAAILGLGMYVAYKDKLRTP